MDTQLPDAATVISDLGLPKPSNLYAELESENPEVDPDHATAGAKF
jgi:hypothetical protein